MAWPTFCPTSSFSRPSASASPRSASARDAPSSPAPRVRSASGSPSSSSPAAIRASAIRSSTRQAPHSATPVSRGAPRLLAPSAVAASRLALAAAALAVGVLQLAGYEVAVLHFGGDSVFALPYYALAGVKRTHAWKDYAPAPDVGAAKDLLATCSTLEDLLQLEERGVRIGQFAVSTHLRRFRKGSVDLADEADRHALIADLATARRALAAAEAIRLDAAPHRRLLARPHAAHARADTGLEALTHARGVVN